MIGGYRTPAGSTVVTNVWAIHHDPDIYDDPERFDAERLMRNRLGIKSSVVENDRDKRKSQSLHVFGVGRRACPGDQLALH